MQRVEILRHYSDSITIKPNSFNYKVHIIFSIFDYHSTNYQFYKQKQKQKTDTL